MFSPFSALSFHGQGATEVSSIRYIISPLFQILIIPYIMQPLYSIPLTTFRKAKYSSGIASSRRSFASALNSFSSEAFAGPLVPSSNSFLSFYYRIQPQDIMQAQIILLVFSCFPHYSLFKTSYRLKFNHIC